MRIDELESRNHYPTNCEKGQALQMFCGHAVHSTMELLINLAIHIQTQSLHHQKPGKQKIYILNKQIYSKAQPRKSKNFHARMINT